jgi:hypothetical protein
LRVAWNKSSDDRRKVGNVAMMIEANHRRKNNDFECLISLGTFKLCQGRDSLPLFNSKNIY